MALGQLSRRRKNKYLLLPKETLLFKKAYLLRRQISERSMYRGRIYCSFVLKELGGVNKQNSLKAVVRLSLP